LTAKRGDFGDLLIVLLKRRRFLFWNVLIVTLLALGTSFLLPVRYRATTTLLPPQGEGEGLLGLGDFLQSLSVPSLNLTGANSTSQIYVAILKSRTVADLIVEEFDLLKRYKARNGEAARKVLGMMTDVSLTSAGVIQVSVGDRDPGIAADMANAYVGHLDRMNRTLRMGEGKRTRTFVEERLRATEDRLQASEDSLLAFKNAHPGIVLPADIAAAAGAAANLMAERISIGVELEVLRSSLHARAPQLLLKERQVAALDRELENLPQLEIDLGRLYRDFKVQEKVFALLTAQFEEARIRENRDVTTVDVLDIAVPPVRKSFPRRGIITASAFAFSLVVGLLLIVCLETLERLDLGNDERLRALVRPGSFADRMLFGSRKTGDS